MCTFLLVFFIALTVQNKIYNVEKKNQKVDLKALRHGFYNFLKILFIKLQQKIEASLLNLKLIRLNIKSNCSFLFFVTKMKYKTTCIYTVMQQYSNFKRIHAQKLWNVRKNEAQVRKITNNINKIYYMYLSETYVCGM